MTLVAVKMAIQISKEPKPTENTDIQRYRQPFG
jgi:hypothetical protein